MLPAFTEKSLDRPKEIDQRQGLIFVFVIGNSIKTTILPLFNEASLLPQGNGGAP